MKLALFAALAIALIAASQWYYQPSVETVAIASALLTGLLALTTWSARRFGKSLAGFFKTALVGVVSALMFSQAMDIAYSILAAPAGGRLAFPIEQLAIGFALAALAQLLASALGSKVEKYSDGDQS